MSLMNARGHLRIGGGEAEYTPGARLYRERFFNIANERTRPIVKQLEDYAKEKLTEPASLLALPVAIWRRFRMPFIPLCSDVTVCSRVVLRPVSSLCPIVACQLRSCDRTHDSCMYIRRDTV